MSTGIESAAHALNISDIAATHHGQIFSGVVSHGNVYYGGNDRTSDTAEKTCLDNLFLIHPNAMRESINAKGRRVKGTCEWITRNETYQAWLRGDSDCEGSSSEGSRPLWISGGPGKGKTMLSLFLTEELERHTADKQNTDLVFFFCSTQDEKRNTALVVLRGLVYQILEKRPRLIKHALAYFETPAKAQQTLLSFEAVWLLFSKLIADPELGTMFCVLDGLDECEESLTRVLTRKLRDLLTDQLEGSNSDSFKLIIVGRDMLNLQKCLRIKLDPDHDKSVTNDIERFVSARVEELSWIDGFTDVQEFVQEELSRRAEGTFLWVGFAMHELQQKQTCCELLDALKELPSGLPAIYSRILLQIPPKWRQISLTILQWVTLAVRPLSLQELAVAADIQSTSPQITAARAVLDAVRICGPIVKLQGQEVTLIHQSARDYLLRRETANAATTLELSQSNKPATMSELAQQASDYSMKHQVSPFQEPEWDHMLRTEQGTDEVLQAFQLDKQVANFKLTQKCLDCIARSILRSKPLNLSKKSRVDEEPLLRYSIMHWPEHARSCPVFSMFLLYSTPHFFDQNSPLRNNWWKTNKDEQEYSEEPLELLHMACYCGIVPWVGVLMETRSSLNKPGGNKVKLTGEDAGLFSAAFRGYYDIVRILLDNGADVNASDHYGETPLHRAVKARQEAIARFLIQRGANVNAKSGSFGPVLLHAAWDGFSATVRLLVEAGADVTACDEEGSNALHHAWRYNDETLAQLLIDKGADVNEEDYDGYTPLYQAVSYRDEALARLLLSNGAASHLTSPLLHEAARRNDYGLIRENLQDQKGDIDPRFNIRAYKEDVTVLQLLLEYGADIEARDYENRTALYIAVSEKNKPAVRVLVERGADIEALREDGKETSAYKRCKKMLGMKPR